MPTPMVRFFGRNRAGAGLLPNYQMRSVRPAEYDTDRMQLAGGSGTPGVLFVDGSDTRRPG